MIDIQHHITEFDGDKSFICIPVDIAEDIERLEVSYTFPAGSGGSVIDIGLVREGVSRGWTGSEYGHIWVAEDRASPGYLPSKVPGRWEIVLGIVKVGPDPFVDLSIRLIPKKPTWRCGELHSHTEHSDGGVLVGEAIARARNSNCDFVALTDHNATSQNRICPDDPGILVIPGMELTTYWGHTNFLGLSDPVVDWRCFTPEDVPRKMAQARENGATIVINHPFQSSAGGRWQVGTDVPFDAYEIWNGIWKKQDQQALSHWQEMLCAGRRIPITGGSDFHLKNRRRHGRPANRIWTDTSTVNGILAAVRRGSNQVCSAPDETYIDLQDETLCFGSEVAHGQQVGLHVSGLAKGDIMRTVSEKGVIGESVAQEDHQDIEHRLESEFVRFEIWRGDKPRVFTNPFYAA